uniref:Uncharacterized protein n=2 Tax=Oryza TaxID=4527 RepID=A0A0E0GF62_ORYNI
MVPINTVSKPNAIPFPHSPHQESAAAAAAGLQALVLRVRSLKRMANVTEEVTFEVKHAPMRYGGIVGLPSGELGVLVYAQPPVGEFDNYAISRDKVMEPVRAPSGQTQGKERERDFTSAKEKRKLSDRARRRGAQAYLGQ